jgi:hypothetical protein
MLFGSRSEKLPPISDAVRRQIEEEEFAEGILGLRRTLPMRGTTRSRPTADPARAPRRRRSRTRNEPSAGGRKGVRSRRPCARSARSRSLTCR